LSIVRALIPYLRWGAIALFGLAAVALTVGVLYFRRARRAPYYVLRETARRRGAIWSAGALGLLLIGALLFLLQAVVPAPVVVAPTQPSPTETATAVVPPTLALTVMPTATPTPMPTATATRRPTATPPLIPTPTPAVPLPADAVARLPDAVPAPADARIMFIAFATEERAGAPVDPGVEFAPGDHRVYFFFQYEGMTRGVTWTYRWCTNGECSDGLTCLWGIRQGECPVVSTASGSTYLFFKPINGYQPGLYEVRVWIEDRLQVAEPFVIRQTP
jgi:hypothetical protein